MLVFLIFEDFILNVRESVDSFTYFMNNDYIRIESRFCKFCEYYLSDVVLSTDNGWITSSNMNRTDQRLGERFDNFYYKNNSYTDDKCIINYYIYASQKNSISIECILNYKIFLLN